MAWCLASPRGLARSRSRDPCDISAIRFATRAVAREVLAWEDVRQRSRDAPLEGFTLREPGAKPSTAPQRTVETSLDSVWAAGVESTHPVLFIRDTDAWCPFCERVWFALEWKSIEYDTMLIDLRRKPSWFTELSPAGVVPVAKIKDQLVPESYEILKTLEKEFPEPPMLSSDPEKRDATLRACDSTEEFASAGYAFMLGRRMRSNDEDAPEPSQQDLRSEFERQLDELEGLFTQYGGPFIMGSEVTLADAMFLSGLERFAAMLPRTQGLSLRGNPTYPGLGGWFDAMEGLPAYQRVRSDERTLQLLLRYGTRFGVKAHFVPEVDEATRAARLEAAAKISSNRDAVLDDILEKSGILRVRSNQYGGTLRALNGYPLTPGPALVEAVDHALRRICSQLLEGTPGLRHECKEACAIGSAALVFFRNRASAPRDLSAMAASELRNACSEVLHDMF